MKPLAQDLSRQLHDLSNDIADHAWKRLKRARELAKARRSVSVTTPDGTTVEASSVDDILDAILDADWATIEGTLSDAMREAFTDAGYQEIATAGNTDRSMFELVDEGARKYSKEHSADLITGLQNTTRDHVRGTIEDAISEGWSKPELAEELNNSYSFGDNRSQVIAHNELAMAHSLGRVDVAKEAGAEKKIWMLSDDHDPDEDCWCSDAADAGEVDMDDTFVDDPDYDFPPGHVNCLCDWAGVYPDGAEKLAKDVTSEERDDHGRWTGGGGMGYAEIVAATRRDGGVSYQPTTHSSPHPGDDAYMVSPYPDRAKVLDAESLTPEQISDYVHNNQDLLTQSDHYLGTWYDKEGTGKVFIDVSIRANTPEEATTIAQQKQQIAYFSFKDMQSHDVLPELRGGITVTKGARSYPDQRQRSGHPGERDSHIRVDQRSTDYRTGTSESESASGEAGNRGLTKYSDDQARDDHGRFTSGGGNDQQSTTSPAAAGLPGRGEFSGSAGVLADARGPDSGPGKDLDGLPTKPVTIPGQAQPVTPSHWQPAERVAQAYMKSAGLPYNPPTTYAKVDPERATRIAAAYDSMEHAPQDPQVKAAYEALTKEVTAQYDAVAASGLKVEFINFQKNGDPYAASPRLMTEDVRNNNHMWVFSTKDGFGSSPMDVSNNPLLADSGRMISGQPATVNDLFRVVHDYFGHVKQGVGFRADGEENAWRSHVSMFSPLAAQAMTSETRGQNSWVNFGPYGEKNRTAGSSETHFADQKTGLMPSWTWTEGLGKLVKTTAYEDGVNTGGGTGTNDLYEQNEMSPDEIAACEKITRMADDALTAAGENLNQNDQRVSGNAQAYTRAACAGQASRWQRAGYHQRASDWHQQAAAHYAPKNAKATALHMKIAQLHKDMAERLRNEATIIARSASKIAKYSPDQPRAPDGKWGDGGSTPEVDSMDSYDKPSTGLKADTKLEHAAKYATFWHGTSAQVVEKIKKEGLVPGHHGGGDDWLKQNEKVLPIPAERLKEMFNRPPSVFLAKSKEVAESYTKFAKQLHPGAGAAILELHIPKNVAKKFVADEFDERALRYQGTIKPEWIAKTELTKGGFMRVFMVVLCKPDVAKRAIDPDAHESATSLKNDLPEPSDRQKHAGNYRMGHLRVGGVDITIENPSGSRRKPEWETLKAHYGYIKRTVGSDGDHVDVFVADGTDDAWDGDVYIVDQMQHAGDSVVFDEHKVLIGFPTQEAATAAYLGSYQQGWKLGHVTRLTWGRFKQWLRTGNHRSPVALQV